jgi:sterol desaturase/sphingolipid hydroxylase (fatty acid hydroxylase superfamily)
MKFSAPLILAVLLAAETLFPFFENGPGRFRHILRNAAWGFLNYLLVSLVFSGATLAVLQWSQDRNFGLLHWLGLQGLAASVAAFLLFDLWMYGWHCLNHTLPFLWKFHRMHHTDDAMDCTTAVRFHSGEIALSSVARLAVIPLLGMGFRDLLFYEAVLRGATMFHHGNLALPESWDRVLRAVFVTPNLHRVHHSLERDETNSNYSTVFSFWDRVGRTYRLRNPYTVRFGIPEMAGERWQTFPAMLKTPFVEAGRP